MKWSLVVLAFISLGCAHPPVRASAVALRPGRKSRKVLLKVPFYTDDTDQCGPSALAGVLGYWGKEAGPGQLRQEVYLKHLRGSLPVDLILAAQTRGMVVRMLNGSLPKVKRELNHGRPLIAFLNVGFRLFPVWHYVVLTGYDDQRGEIIMDTGTRKDAALPYDRFAQEWERAEKWALLIVPRSAQ